MLHQLTTADQLREARIRIAALEQELRALRSSTNAIRPNSPSPSPSPSPHPPPPPPPPSAAPPAPPLAPTAPAPTVATSKEAHNDPSSSPPSTPPISPLSPLSPALLDKPSTPILTRRAAAAAAAAAAFSTAPAAPPREAPKVAPAVVTMLKPAPVVERQPPPANPPVKVEPKLPAVSVSSRAPPEKQQKSPKQVAPKPAVQISSTIISKSAQNAPPLVRSATAPTSLPPQSAPHQRQSQKRRPPPLSVLKTTSTKKDRSTIVAKCLEPKPGQTRYWTEDEHERFLEAMAEYGEKAYVAISNFVETRTPKQVRTHAQKFQMKMARLARQNLESGQPIQMPAGMCPVIEVPMGSKSTIVAISAEQAAQLSARSIAGGPGLDITTVTSLPGAVPQTKKRILKSNKEQEGSGAEQTERDSPSVSDESSSSLTDSYLNYMRTPAPKEEDVEMDNTFDAKLSQTLQCTDDGIASNSGDFLISDRSSNESASSGEDDQLEELEKLEDGELPLAPFANPSESWLLPDSATLSSV